MPKTVKDASGITCKVSVDTFNAGFRGFCSFVLFRNSVDKSVILSTQTSALPCKSTICP
jgi:hypothetical protein